MAGGCAHYLTCTFLYDTPVVLLLMLQQGCSGLLQLRCLSTSRGAALSLVHQARMTAHLLLCWYTSPDTDTSNVYQHHGMARDKRCSLCAMHVIHGTVLAVWRLTDLQVKSMLIYVLCSSIGLLLYFVLQAAKLVLATNSSIPACTWLGRNVASCATCAQMRKDNMHKHL